MSNIINKIINSAVYFTIKFAMRPAILLVFALAFTGVFNEISTGDGNVGELRFFVFFFTSSTLITAITCRFLGIKMLPSVPELRLAAFLAREIYFSSISILNTLLRLRPLSNIRVIKIWHSGCSGVVVENSITATPGTFTICSISPTESLVCAIDGTAAEGVNSAGTNSGGQIGSQNNFIDKVEKLVSQ